MLNLSRRATSSGFTLIELLVVIAIIGILSSVVLVSLNQTRAKSRDSKRLAELRSIRNAIELYRLDNGVAPPGAGALDAGVALQTLVTGNYLSVLPLDPDRTGNAGYYYRNNTGSSSAVAGDSDTQSYAIRFWMETGSAVGPGGNYYCLTSRGIEPTPVPEGLGTNTCAQR